MEEMNLQELQHILTEDLFLIKEEFKLSPKSSDSPVKESKPAPIEMVKEPESEDLILAKEPIAIRGKFENGVLILHEEEELAPEVMGMLVKMINAVNHSMNEVGLLSSKDLEGRSLEEFKDLNAHKVLKFGRIKHPINALPATDYVIYTDEETEYLFADSLTVISEDNTMKRSLWNNLQILFNIKSNK